MSIVLAAPSSDELPPAPDLHLLPFSLTPTPPTAPISTYFRPRVAPQSHPAAGRQIAAFRGRQVVAQQIPVPRGYVGVVLRAEGCGAAGPSLARPAVASASKSTSTSTQAATRAPLPAPSDARVTRARGAGQVALERPRTRRAQPKRKFILSEDEDDEEEDAPAVTRVKVEEKREDRAVTPPMPAIRVVAATPGTGSELAGASIVSVAASVEGVEEVITEEEVKEEAKVEESKEEEVDEEVLEVGDVKVGEDALGKPARQELLARDSSVSVASLSAVSAIAEEEGPVRILTPVSTFSNFTLWTPDAPLAGFDPDEVVAEGAWRRGGAGDGGDEFVRALGEWMGLCEVIHTPLYEVDDEE